MNKSGSNNNLETDKLCKIIGYDFTDPKLLQNALTHSSFCYEHQLKYSENNERLEFLGDAIFDTVIAEYLYYRLKDNEEGALSKLRASIVCEQSLMRKAGDIGLSDYLRLGHGEEVSGSTRKRRSLIADALEATIGAIYLDGGWEITRSVVLNLFEDIIEDALNGKLKNDYKTALQELLQSKGESNIVYNIEGEQGPDHDKTFFAVLRNNGKIIGRGSGSTKKQAEQNAAREALEQENENCILKS
ncbi:MAG: ribonuclease III [Firmicutes bacterium]|nr:ribonuclease III [Bacillota bacterium]